VNWPSAPIGNDRALTHGGYGDVSDRVRELVTATLDTNPHLDALRNGAAITRYATVLARCERVYKWLGEQPDDVFADVEHGITHPVLDRLRRWEGQADGHERALAIAPLTRAKLGLTQALAWAASGMCRQVRLILPPSFGHGRRCLRGCVLV
jgi:hypothetical protein